MRALGAPKQYPPIAPYRHFLKKKKKLIPLPIRTLLGANNFTITKSDQGHCTNYIISDKQLEYSFMRANRHLLLWLPQIMFASDPLSTLGLTCNITLLVTETLFENADEKQVH